LYDSTSVANGVGRLSEAWTQSGQAACSTSATKWTIRSILAYDPVGRVLNEQQCAFSNCTSGTPYTPAYTYDLAGNDLTFTDGVTPTSTAGTMLSLTNNYDAANHLSSLTSNWVDGTHPVSLFSSPRYAAPGGLASVTIGTGLSLTRTYDSRLRVNGETDTGGAVVNATNASATATITGAEQSQ